MKLVEMKKGDKTADVHPDMVDEYAKGGYELVKPAPKQEPKTPAKKGK